MSAPVVLILRLALAITLYAFLGWAFFTLLHDLRQQGTRLSLQKKLGITFYIKIEQDRESVRHLTQTEIIIGRDPNCDIAIMDEAMSAHHVRVTYHHGQWWLEDLNSTNGTLLNREKLTTAAVIITGDEFTCGNTVFSVQIDAEDRPIPSIPL